VLGVGKVEGLKLDATRGQIMSATNYNGLFGIPLTHDNLISCSST
jgi:hypothetical protein